MEPRLIQTQWWRGAEDELDPVIAELEVEPDDEDTNAISIHTFFEGRGSLSTYVFDRESARRLALRLLLAAEV